jgi:hypothetical protein
MVSQPRDEGNLTKDSCFLSLGVWRMGFLHMHELLAHLSAVSSYLPAVLITLGVATLIGCAIGCICSPCEEKDDLFHREVF